MSVYVLDALVHSQVAKVGWDHDLRTYWYVLYDRGPSGEVDMDLDDRSGAVTIHLVGGLEFSPPIHSPAKMVMETWGFIRWTTPEAQAVFVQLRDDPSLEEMAHARYVPPDLEAWVLETIDDRRIWEANGGGAFPGRDPAPAPEAPKQPERRSVLRGWPRRQPRHV